MTDRRSLSMPGDNVSVNPKTPDVSVAYRIFGSHNWLCEQNGDLALSSHRKVPDGVVVE